MRFFAAVLLTTALSAQSPTSIPSISITHVTVIDMTGSPPRSNMTVLIRGNRIVSITRDQTEAKPVAGTKTIDATGKFLIPGLWDMHVHTGQKEIYLPLYIANGITGIRDMGGDLAVPTGYSSVRYVQLSLWREAIEAGTLIGPRMILAGYLIDGYSWPGNVTV